ncbi:MAG: glycogen/starch synthase [Salinibacter sp.]
MSSSNRLLFAAGALTPYTERSPLASLTRSLPEAVQNAGNFEIRLMMPCYAGINERKHNLHEVIRLSDTEVPMGADTETVTVKVASVPDTQLQVYFMDHDSYFGQDGSANDTDDDAYRALFFSRSVLETIRELRWGPDLIHSFGWITSFMPSLLAISYADADLFDTTRSVFTPGETDPGARVQSAFAERTGLSLDGNTGSTLPELGHAYADTTILAPPQSPSDGLPVFDEDAVPRTEQAVSLYDQMLSEVPA